METPHAARDLGGKFPVILIFTFPATYNTYFY